MSDYKKIVFLASYPKSGNTWVRCFLDAYFLGEVDINDLVCSVTDDHSHRHQIGDGSDVRELPLCIQFLTRPMALLRLVQSFKENGYANVPLFVKTHFPHVIANGIETLPESLTYSVVHIVRDPCEVLPSFANHMGCSHENAYEALCDKGRSIVNPKANKVGTVLGAWDDYVRGYLKADTHNVMTIRYEDMKGNPVDSFCKILEHSGVTPDIVKVKKALEVVELGKLQKQEQENGFKESSPNSANKFFGHTKKKIDSLLRAKVQRKFHRVLKQLGYIGNKWKAA